MKILVLNHKATKQPPITEGVKVFTYENWIEFPRLLFTADVVFVWNGQGRFQREIVNVCRTQKIPILFYEQGLFGQKDNCQWDTKGFNGESSLNDPLVVSDSVLQNLRTKRSKLQEQYPLDPQGHVLAVLQVERDTQIRYHSPYPIMSDFIKDLVRLYPTQKVVIRPHPKGDYNEPLPDNLPDNFSYDKEGDFLTAASQASCVVGITSTCLFESAILGVPTFSFGHHPLRVYPPDRREELLARALDQNLPVQTPADQVVSKFFG